MPPIVLRSFVLSVLLLALALPACVSAEGPAATSQSPKPASREHPLARALLERDQEEAVRLIRSGTALDVLIERDLIDDRLPRRSMMISYGDGVLPGYPLALAAAALGLPGVLDAIGERDPSQLHVADSNNKTAINYAAEQGYAKSVAVLLRHGLNPLQPPHDGRASGTPLSRAVWGGHPQVVKLLLDAIPRAQYGSERVTEQVWLATFPQVQEHLDVLKALLDAGVSPNYVAPQGGTALINAIENQNPVQVRLLIEHGAKAYSHGYRGRTAHEWAAHQAGENASPRALEVARLVGALAAEPSSWRKSEEVEKFERIYRMIGQPGKAPPP